MKNIPKHQLDDAVTLLLIYKKNLSPILKNYKVNSSQVKINGELSGEILVSKSAYKFRHPDYFGLIIYIT